MKKINKIFLNFLLLAPLYSLQSFAAYTSDNVTTQNHYSNISLHEFSHLSIMRNSFIFLNQKADEIKIRCTIINNKLKIILIEDETIKTQFVDIENCKSQLLNTATQMIKNPLKFSLSIVFDHLIEESDTNIYKLQLKDITSNNEVREYLDIKASKVSEEVIQ